MPASPTDAFLDRLAQMAPLEPKAREAVGATLRLRTVARGEAVVREGERCHDVFFVADGLLRVYFLSDGQDRTAYFAPDGHMVSDYESFLTGQPARMTIEAVEASTLVVLPRATIEWAYATLPQGDRIGRRVAEALFLETHRRLASFYLDSAEARYARLLEEHPGLVQRVPQHLIASYVGVRAPSLSRIRRRWAEAHRSSPG